MKHYDQIEWILYKKKVLPEEKIIKMEEHLYTCDECLETFLSLIDTEEIQAVEDTMAEDFTDRVMAKIENIDLIPRTKGKKARKNYREIFVYYTAVAAVTIVLTMGGIFTKLVDAGPHVVQSSSMEENVQIPNMVADLSGRIVSKTSSLINKFEESNIKEDVNERKE